MNVLYMAQERIACHVVILNDIAQLYFFRSTAKYLARELLALALIGLVKYLPSTSSLKSLLRSILHSILFFLFVNHILSIFVDNVVNRLHVFVG